jgi:hypothetical protein
VQGFEVLDTGKLAKSRRGSLPAQGALPIRPEAKKRGHDSDSEIAGSDIFKPPAEVDDLFDWGMGETKEDAVDKWDWC